MKRQDFITVKGAKEHNLKNINVKIPKNKLIVLSGLSGSGKSSFAFDTLYAEGQRRYVESLSAYARQFLGIMKKPEVESIEGLSPAISIDQKTISHNPRSTVGTITEIYDYLRLLFARIGHPHCPQCGQEISQLSLGQIIKNVLDLLSQETAISGKKPVRFLILAPIVKDRKGEFSQLFNNIGKKGFVRFRIDKQIFDPLSENFTLIKTNKHTIEVVVDRMSATKESILKKDFKMRLQSSVETALQLSNGLVVISQIMDDSFDFPVKPKKFKDRLFSEKFACPACGLSLPEIEPRLFSFNTPHGACPDCHGLGRLQKIDKELIINPNLSIAEGGILPYSKMITHNTWWYRLIKKVSEKYHFSLNTTIKNLSKNHLQILLYGPKPLQTFAVLGQNHQGQEYSYEAKFEGIIPNLEKRYRETQSDYSRQEIEKYMRKEVCPSCQGSRLKPEVLKITIDAKNIVDIVNLPINKAKQWCQSLQTKNLKLSKTAKKIAKPILKELTARFTFLVSVGLEYLTLSREAASLSGGEAQRIRLASQIGSGLSGVLYVLDEPSIGLHQKDNQQLISTLKGLTLLGNTAVVVEHDRETIANADYILDFGPQAGDQGGEVVAIGSPADIIKTKRSITGQYLSGRKKINLGKNRPTANTHWLTIFGCKEHNLQNIDVKFPLSRFICITGVSGSGKSTLLHDTLYHAVSKAINIKYSHRLGNFSSLSGANYINRISLVDQSPIGRTPRSNPATYVKAFDFIREIFSQTKEAKIRGYKPGRFSFNVKGGRCESCRGGGQIKIEMQFLPDIYVDCEVCQGLRYNQETLEVYYRGKNISQVLNLSIEEALKTFAHIGGLKNKLETLCQVGLGYLKLGQPAPTLSGGEAQRVKLAAELAKQSKKHNLYLLDEPTTGLHFADIEKLITVLQKLVDKGNTVIVIEHNLDFIKNADWIIDLGPKGGENGGRLIAQGKPSQIIEFKNSYTGQYLAKYL